MKQLLLSLFFVAVVLGCRKNETATDDPTPVASFKITNFVEDGVVMESTAVVFENNSQNADSFEWDFGSGRVSTERTPSGVMFRQCPRVEEIRLTVRTRRGRAATIVQTIRVRCR